VRRIPSCVADVVESRFACEAATVEAIYQASSGLPRKANSLAHHALFAAAISKAKTVNTEHVQAALQEVA
jgi:hypothetical protein